MPIRYQQCNGIYSNLDCVPLSRFAGPDGIESVKRHPFFASISWEALLAKRVAPPFKPTVVSDEAFHFDTAFTSKTPKGGGIDLIPFYAFTKQFRCSNNRWRANAVFSRALVSVPVACTGAG